MEVALSRASLRGKVFPLVALFILIIAGANSILAQSTASLGGTVTDGSGGAVPGASVVARNQATGVEFSTTTDSSGAYLFPSLPIGTYRLEIKASNFQTSVLSNMRLEVASSQIRDVQLKIGQATQTVEVVADAAVVDTTTNSMGQVINDKTVQEIPLNGRHFTDLSLLTAGTVTPPANGFLSAPLRGQGSFGINTAGQREDTTNWLVNGINLNDPVQNQLTFQPPIDTLAEYKIDNSTFPAQYGRNSGAIVNLATRSGSNEFHGEGFDFLRNNAVDARNFFNPIFNASGALQPQFPFKRNDFGATFGGPIKKNKLFFFLAYEGIRQSQAVTISSTVPSATQRAAVTSTAVQQLLTLVPAANQVGSGTATDPNTFNLFVGGTAAHVGINQGSADIDFVISDRDRVHGYFVYQRDLRQEPTQNANLPGFGDTRDGKRSLMTVSEDHVFSPRLTNTVRLGYNRIHLFFTPTQLDPTAFDINMPAGGPGAVGLPNILVTGAMSFGGPVGEPQGRGDTTVVLNDTLSWLRGRHTFTFGGEIRRGYNNNVALNIGSFSYPNLNAFLNDSATNFTVLLGAGNNRVTIPSYGVFAQDSYKLKSNFTVNIGFRYEWNSTPSEASNRFTNFDLASGTLVPASQPYKTNNKNFEPRIGFAWDPFKDGRTSVRAGYAITTQAPNSNIITGLSSSPPFALPLSIATANIQLENPSGAVSTVSLGPALINPDFKNAYAQDWNLSIERQLTSSMGLTVAYVGTKGTHLQITENYNQPFLVGGNYDVVRPFLTLPTSSPVLPAQCAAPNPPCTFGNLNRIDSPGNSNYNALWITLTKNLARGLQFSTSYTWSKAFDYNSLSSAESIPLQNAYNPRGDYGLSEYDVRNRIVFSGFYELPFKRTSRLIGGWQVGVVTQAQSGSPLTPTAAVNVAATVVPPRNITLTVRPDLTATPQITGDPLQWFVDKTVFVAPCLAGVCHPGDMARDSVHGPDFVDTDFNVTKSTKITEKVNVIFRTEFFDIFNHPNFGNPNLAVGSGNFGRITSTRFTQGDFGSSRQIQFGLKLQF